MFSSDKPYPVFIILLIALLFSCSSGFHDEFYDDNGNLVEREWYDKQNLESTTTYLNPDHTEYIYTSWYSDGRLNDSARYINDTLDGLRKFYEKNTGLVHYENYNYGVLNGVHKAVYNSGVTSFEGYRKDNWKVGEWKFHFPNGNPITYEYYDSVGKLLYFRKYDNEGNVLKETGKELIGVTIKQTSVNESESCTGFVEAAVPPGNKTILSIAEEIPGQNPDEFFTTEMKKPKIKWETRFDSPGDKKLLFTLKVKEIKTGEEETYTFEQKIKVNAKSIDD
ncbi:MAG: hypothetical protein B6D61_04490 [Bacteroidetes bacterium 4484_249]|nr:MAG: hypothetical protein B6D61_04490 [Bacteroidetes bacterium 4484_249]